MLLWRLTSYVVTNLTGALLWVYFFVLNRTTVVGRSNVGEQPNTLLVTNHQSPLDSFLVGLAAFYPKTLLKPYLLPWNPAAAEHFYTNPFTSWVADNWRCIPVQRGRRDQQVLQRMAGVLLHGVMILFPEGMRSRDGSVGRGRPGAGFIALSTGARVIPVAIDGLDELWPVDHFALRVFKRIYVAYGPPIDCSEFFDMPPGRESAQRLVDRVMQEIRMQRAALQQMRREAGDGGSKPG